MLNSMNQGKQLLQKAFEERYAKIKDNELCEQTARSKLKHSFQVLGIGNYLLRNEALFKNKNSDYITDCQAVCLLHDIGRFKELEFLYNDINSHHNHALYSYQVLKDAGYNNLRILLPVKHHTYDISLLENDDEFINIQDNKLKAEIIEIYKLIKDADKLANLYIAKTQNRLFHDLLSKKILQQPLDSSVSEEIYDSFSNHQLAKTSKVKNLNDRFLQVLSFIFDINFKFSFKFIKFHGLSEYLLIVLSAHNKNSVQQKDIEEISKNYIEERLK